MSTDEHFEKLLKERQATSDKLIEFEEKIMSLDAYKKTLVKCLCPDDLAFSFPLELEHSDQDKIICKNEEFPLFIINSGVFPSSKSTHNAIPANFKCLRKFKKIGFTNRYTWYTTTVLKKKNGYIFIIQDDENNTWEGQNAFLEFSASFNNEIPFKTIHEWLGFEYEEPTKKPNSLNQKNNDSTLDTFFSKKDNYKM